MEPLLNRYDYDKSPRDSEMVKEIPIPQPVPLDYDSPTPCGDTAPESPQVKDEGPIVIVLNYDQPIEKPVDYDAPVCSDSTLMENSVWENAKRINNPEEGSITCP